MDTSTSKSEDISEVAKTSGFAKIAAHLPPPIVLVSTSVHTQSSNTVQFTFEWSEDVSSNSDDSRNFIMDDVELYDHQGNQLKLDRLDKIDNMEPQPNTAYYGEAVARVPPLVESGHLYVGVVTTDAQWVEAFVPELAVCSPLTGLCNSFSNIVRVNIDTLAIPCVEISSAAAPKTSEPVIPLTFEFTSDVDVHSFTASDVAVYAYDLGFSSVTSIDISTIIGGPRRFYATVNAPGLPLDHLEVFVNGVQDVGGNTFCESKHLRLAFVPQEETHTPTKGVYEEAPQTRQFGSRRFAPPPMSLPALRPSTVARASSPYYQDKEVDSRQIKLERTQHGDSCTINI